MAVGVSGVDVPQAYVALCLRLRRLVPALVAPISVDPTTWRTVATEPLSTAAELVREAGRLGAVLPDAGLPHAREVFLARQLTALEWRARGLAGQHVPFRREVRECLRLAVRPGEPDAYRAAHRELAALLPGSGPLLERLAAHRLGDTVPRDRLGLAVRTLSEALRDRVGPRYALPPGEEVEYRFLDDGAWGALQAFVDGRRSVVQINAHARPGAGRLPRLVAHEAYPGHHTECVRSELAVARGHVELGVTVLGSPQTVVSEGLAECALTTVVGTDWGPWGEAVLATAGVSADGGLAQRLDLVRAALRRVRLDAALLLHGDGRPTADAVAAAEAYVRRWLLLDDGRVRRVVDALAHRLWRTHVVASVEGYELMREWLHRPHQDPAAEHLRLLDAPSVPDALRVRTSTESLVIHDGR